jgi:STE24 endopeptidase
MVHLSYAGQKTEEKEKLALRYFTAEEINKGIEYNRRGISAGILQRLVDFSFPFIFFFSPLARGLAKVLWSFSGEHAWIQVIIFTFIYLAAGFLVSLPFRFYFGYVLEHRFGFSNMDKKSWVLYNLKSFLVGLVMTTAIFSAAYYVLRRVHVHWIWIIPVVMLGFELFFTFLYPYLILPLFYKKSKFEDEKYAAPIRDVAERSGVRVKKIFQINESKYSKHTNAFFTGFGPEKSIYIYDTLVKNNTPEQVASVVAHEVGHWKHHHVLKGIALSFLGAFLMAALIYFTFPALAGNPALTSTVKINNIAGLPLLMIIITVYSFYLSPLDNFISRKFEVTADTYEINMGGHPEVYIKSMVQLAKDNRSFLYPHPLVTAWYASHPPILDRVKMGEKFNKDRKSVV